MFIGNFESFIGTKIQSVINTEDFVFFKTSFNSIQELFNSFFTEPQSPQAP